MPYALTKPTPSLPNIFTMSFNILFQSIYLFFYLFPLESKTACKNKGLGVSKQCMCVSMISLAVFTKSTILDQPMCTSKSEWIQDNQIQAFTGKLM